MYGFQYGKKNNNNNKKKKKKKKTYRQSPHVDPIFHIFRA